MLIIQVIIWRKCVQQLPHFPVRPVHHTLFYSMSSRDPPRNPQMRTRLHYILTTQLLTCVVEPSYGMPLPMDATCPWLFIIFYYKSEISKFLIFVSVFQWRIKKQTLEASRATSVKHTLFLVHCNCLCFFIFLGIVRLPPLFSSATVAHPQA